MTITQHDYSDILISQPSSISQRGALPLTLTLIRATVLRKESGNFPVTEKNGAVNLAVIATGIFLTVTEINYKKRKNG